MLQELYIWALSRASASARSAGLVYEAAAIAGRYRRNRKHWQAHTNTVKRIISEKLKLADADKPIMLLGAGLGLDIPFTALNNHPAGAILVDAVLTPQMRSQIRRFKNLSFRCIDITGFLAPFWQNNVGEKITPPTLAPISLANCSMVISCNILSQLPLNFTNSPPVGDTEIRITAAIQHAHMHALKELNCPILLITDYERIETQDGEETRVATVPVPLLPSEPLEEWLWDIAPCGELGKNKSSRLKVGAWLFGR